MLHRRADAVCRVLAAASCFLSSPFSHPLAAQHPDTRTLERGTLIRVTTLQGLEMEGRVVRFEPEALRVAHVDGSQSTVARVHVRSLEVARSRTGRYAKRGALAGAVGGGAMGVVFLNGFCSGSTTCGAETDIFVVGGGLVAGALAGTLIGALVGWAASDWVEVGAGVWETSRPRLEPALAAPPNRHPPSLAMSLRLPLPL